MARSNDRGATWKESVVDDGVMPTERIVVLFPPAPSVAVDPRSGRVYAAFHDGRAADVDDGRLGHPDVWLWASRDGGATFARPTRVNDTPRRDRSAQYLPKVAVAPSGRVDVVYYDRRADPRNVMNETSLQSSLDGGRTFSSRLRLSDRPFSSKIGFGSERQLPDLGSRLALVAGVGGAGAPSGAAGAGADRAGTTGADRALAVWTDTRAGTEASNKQDLALAEVRFSKPSSMSRALRPVGFVLVGAGLALLVSSLMDAGRRREADLPPVPPGGDDRTG